MRHGTCSSTRSQLSSNARANVRNASGRGPAARRGEGSAPSPDRRAVRPGTSPSAVRRQPRSYFVEHLDPWWEASFIGCSEGSAREGVQCPDGRAVELFKRHPAPCFLDGARLRLDALLEPASDAVTQLGRRLLGEGDRCDARELRRSGHHECQHAADERGRLPGAGAGVDHQRRGEIGTDPGSSRLIGGLRHSRISRSQPSDDSRISRSSARSSASPSARSKKAATAGSPFFRSIWRRSSTTPNASGSQYSQGT